MAIELRLESGLLVGTADGVESRGAGARCYALSEPVHRTACAPLQTRRLFMLAAARPDALFRRLRRATRAGQARRRRGDRGVADAVSAAGAGGGPAQRPDVGPADRVPASLAGGWGWGSHLLGLVLCGRGVPARAGFSDPMDVGRCGDAYLGKGLLVGLRRIFELAELGERVGKFAPCFGGLPADVETSQHGGRMPVGLDGGDFVAEDELGSSDDEFRVRDLVLWF